MVGLIKTIIKNLLKFFKKIFSKKQNTTPPDDYYPLF